MARELRAADWLAVLRRDYLDDFLPNRGAAVKFAVPFDHAAHDALLRGFRHTAAEANYLVAVVDAATTKANMVDQIFFAVAREVDWNTLTLNYLRGLLATGEYHLPDADEDFTLARIAELNGYDPRDMRVLINQIFTDRLTSDYAMVQEFRTVIQWLCQAQLNPGVAHAGVADSMKEWLRGELRTVSSAMRLAGIFRRIGRHNARHMLTSLAWWLHLAGKSGLALALDISSFLAAKRSLSGSLYYSRAAILDGYEVLREFVDGVDELEYGLIVVVAPPAFLDQDDNRGLWAYDALKLRILDEVYDPQRPNPLSPLVRLAGETKATDPVTVNI